MLKITTKTGEKKFRIKNAFKIGLFEESLITPCCVWRCHFLETISQSNETRIGGPFSGAHCLNCCMSNRVSRPIERIIRRQRGRKQCWLYNPLECAKGRYLGTTSEGNLKGTWAVSNHPRIRRQSSSHWNGGEKFIAVTTATSGNDLNQLWFNIFFIRGLMISFPLQIRA